MIRIATATLNQLFQFTGRRLDNEVGCKRTSFAASTRPSAGGLTGGPNKEQRGGSPGLHDMAI